MSVILSFLWEGVIKQSTFCDVVPRGVEEWGVGGGGGGTGTNP